MNEEKKRELARKLLDHWIEHPEILDDLAKRLLDEDVVDWDDKAPVVSYCDHPIFKSAPAFQALKDKNDPTPEHLRACIMELSRIILTLHKKIESK